MMNVTTLNKPDKNYKIYLGTIMIALDIIGFIIYGIAVSYKSFYSDISTIIAYVIDNTNFIANAYLPYSIANILFICFSILAYIALGIFLIWRMRNFNITFTITQITTVFLYCFKHILLINSTVYVVTSGEIKSGAFSDYNFLIQQITKNTKYMYSSIFLIVISVILIIYVWKSKHFNILRNRN